MKGFEKYISLILFAAILYATGFYTDTIRNSYPDKSAVHSTLPDREDGFHPAGTFHLECLLVKHNPIPTRVPQAELKTRISFQAGIIHAQHTERVTYQTAEQSHIRQRSYLQHTGHYIYALRKIII